MALIDDCVLWNKLGNAGEVAASEIGQNGTPEVNVTYAPCKFDNGFLSDAGLERVDFPDTDINTTKGIIEFWWKPDFNRGAKNAYLLADRAGVIQISGTLIGTIFDFLVTGNSGSAQARTLVAPAFSAGDLIHLLFVWDNDEGFDGTKTVAVYWDGTQISSITINFGAWTLDGILRIGIVTSATNAPINGLNANGIIDNIKIYDDVSADIIAAILANKDNEGFPAPPPVQVIEPIVCAKSYPQVLVAGKDLYALNYVKEIINIDELKTFRQSKLIQNNYNMVLNNMKDAFSVDNPNSLFAGLDWRYGPIQIIDDDGEEIWKGVIEDIQRDHKTKLATMSTKNSLVKVMNTKIAYTSADWETTANAARNILDQENYTDYNVASFTSSAATLDSNSCYVKCFFNLEDDITLQQCLEKLAEFGAAYSYAHAGDLYYKHWKPFTGGVKVNLTIADLASPPIVSSSINDLVNDYSIGYENDEDIPATDLANGNIGSVSRSKFGTHSVRETDGSANSQIVYKDLTSAVYIGETLIKRVHQDLDKSYVEPLTIMEFSLPLKHQEWVDLETFYRFSFSEEGWTDKLFEVFRFQRNFDQDRIDMLGMGRQE